MTKLGIGNRLDEKLFSVPVIAFIVLCVSVTYLHAFLACWPMLQYSPDSWAYIELSRTFGHDPFRFNTFRSYFSAHYSASFPLGFPFVLYMLERVFGHHDTTGLFLNLAVALLTPVLAEACFRKLKAANGLGLFSAAILLLYQPYLDEVFGGRSIPLTIFTYLGVFWLLLDALKRETRLLYGVAGVVSGACILLRFDSLFFTMALLFLVWDQTRNAKLTALFGCGILVGVFPWVEYSFVHFSTLFVSDNSWVAKAASPAFVLDYPASASKTLFTAPIAWALRIGLNLVLFIKYLLAFAVYYDPPLILALGCLAHLSLGQGDRFSQRDTLLPGFLIASLIGTTGTILTGYFGARYFALLFFLAFSVCAVRLAQRSTQPERGSFMGLMPIACLILALLVANTFIARQWLIPHATRLIQDHQDELIMADLRSCQQHERQVLYVFDDGLFAAKYGVRTGLRAGGTPSNWDRLPEFMKEKFKLEFKPVKFFKVSRLRSVGRAHLCDSLDDPG